MYEYKMSKLIIKLKSLFVPALFSIFVLVIFSTSAMAQSDLCDPGGGGVPLGTCLKLSNDTPVEKVYSNPAFLVNLLVRNLMIVGGMFVLVLAILAGYSYLTKGKKGVEDAKQIATWGLVGFLIMFGAYWIVQIIKLITGADIIL